MMVFNDFKKNIIDNLEDFYGDDAEVLVNDVLKRNDTTYTGISVHLYNEDGGVAPILYLENYYNQYREGNMDMGEIMDSLVSSFENSDANKIPRDLSWLTDWDSVKDRVFPFVIQTENNHKLIEPLIATNYMDLSVIYQVRILNDENGIGSTKITKELFKKYNITVEELHEQAISNLRAEGYVTKSMLQIMQSVLGEEDFEETYDLEEMIPGEMYVTTTTKSINGAAVILDVEYFLQKFGEMCAFILPSSIHELIVVPASDKIDKGYLDEMIKEVNSTCVEAQDRLSNHAYFYDGFNKLIRCA